MNKISNITDISKSVKFNQQDLIDFLWEKKQPPSAALLNVIKLCMERAFPSDPQETVEELLYEP